eukprot:364283-Chlamydomonas_euryale.AAC.21
MDKRLRRKGLRFAMADQQAKSAQCTALFDMGWPRLMNKGCKAGQLSSAGRSASYNFPGVPR